LAGFVEFTVLAGADFNTILDLKDAGGFVLNLTGYQAAAQMRKSYYSDTAINFNVTVSDASAGKITMTMSSAVSSTVVPGRYVYDVLITSPSNIKTRVIEGIVTVLPAVTR
jgi:hypothetical protein